MPVKILHAADFHMDSPFASLTEEKAVERRREQRALLNRLRETAEKTGAQIVLLSGDLFDSGSSYWETGESLSRMFDGMKAEVFIAPGNHDYYTSRSPYAFMDLPSNVHIFRTPQLRSFELTELGVRVWGAGFSSSTCEPLLRGFTAAKSDLIELMVLHGDVAAASRYNAISESDIAGSGLDYLALGHVHSFSGIKKAGGTFYAYPGCLEGRGFDETGPKGVITGTVSKGACELEFTPIEGRQYRIVDVDLTGAADPAEAALAAVGDGWPRDVVRLVLRGSISGGVNIGGLTDALGGKAYHLTVRDETRPIRDIWAGVGDDTLTGLYLARLRSLYDEAADDGERERIELAARYGVAALEGREELTV